MMVIKENPEKKVKSLIIDFIESEMRYLLGTPRFGRLKKLTLSSFCGRIKETL